MATNHVRCCSKRDKCNGCSKLNNFYLSKPFSAGLGQVRRCACEDVCNISGGGCKGPESDGFVAILITLNVFPWCNVLDMMEKSCSGPL